MKQYQDLTRTIPSNKFLFFLKEFLRNTHYPLLICFSRAVDGEKNSLNPVQDTFY